ncbi:beta-lactamase/transpeptidase-like protein [Suillus clintonianus]|uniref:beta-lactamase/transpeptidase-like protein n=1 Tax=Suillus clintonianus TaxID=1904413 RepID=UPI001B877692|nr:beta-lactamase/transpeptidase-like protein [Suillus clintonianus]KAG2128999.1 beta-lactamase/transpeptidase-like protein [Suillus clintonianus]
MARLLSVALGFLSQPFAHLPQLSFLADSVWVNNGQVITPQLSHSIQETLDIWNITGLSVAVVPRYGEPEFHSWGNMTEDGDKTTEDTLFHMASVSKAFCASALGILMDDFEHGRNVTPLPPALTEFNWHTLVQDILPGEWQLMDDWASKKANLKDILSHVSGLPRHDYSYGPYDSPKDDVLRMRYLRPAFELREQWSYNNKMFTAVAHIVETYSAQTYTSFVEDRIFTPLGMSSSTYSPAKAGKTGKFTQGWTSNGRLLPECFTEEMATLMAGAGGVISSAVDMSKWVALWLNKGVHNNVTVIPLSVYGNASQSYSVSISAPDDSEHSIQGYGMGWFRYSYLGHDLVYHTGSVPGLSTLAAFLPDDDVGVVVFANGGDKATPVMDISNRIIDAALNLRSKPSPPIKPSTTEKKAITPPNSDVVGLELALDEFSGTYTNAGYGPITFCSSSGSSSYCQDVISDFTAVDSAQSSAPQSPQLFAAWPRIWSSHIRGVHQSGNTFLVQYTSLFPEGYGRDRTPFETAEIGTSEVTGEFVVEDGKVVGIGLVGLVGQVTERERTHTTVKDRAEIWFDKV